MSRSYDTAAPLAASRRATLAVLCAALVLFGSGDSSNTSLAEDPTTPAQGVKGDTPQFERDVKPLLAERCARCHGEKSRKAELDLSTLAGLQKGGESGAVVEPESAEESLLFEKVRDGEMPPDEKDRLSDAEVATIRQWIEAGAWTRHSATENAAAAFSQHDVIPILLRRCSVCHGLRRQEGELDLRTKESMLRGGKSGPAIVPGNPDASPALKRINASEMPPRQRLVEVSVKPMEPAEIETLEKWIAAGAPEVELQAEVAGTGPDTLVTEKDRDYWAFRSPHKSAAPRVKAANLVRNAVDAFILDKLEQKGLVHSPEASRLTLLRRATYDLTGLPPSPEEVDAYLADERPGAYERLIDRLLASPHYGERWARFWLDLAGYADSEGKREQDLPRPHAWRYRDYVIRALNSNKPYDRFLLEQIAGDELYDYEHAPEITEEIYDALVATGFLRMTPDATWANITGYLADRVEVIADEMDVLGSAVMGLTLKCARCHSHKFDPLPQRDYYRMVAIFRGAYDEYDWLKPDVRAGLGPVSEDIQQGRHLPYVTTAERRAWESHNAAIDAQIAELRAAVDQPQAESEQQIAALGMQKLPEPRVQALWDRGDPSPVYLYRRGDSSNTGQLVGPGIPSALTDGSTPFEVAPPWPGAKQTGRRLALARWITQADHPLTARVMVNRLWKHHFGTGIVKTLGNFGKAGVAPTHPELLDWLAIQFVEQGWDIKAMHRLMMTSATYRQSSAVNEDLLARDPANALLSRMPLVRLDAEESYDALLAAAGRLNDKPFGPADKVEARPDGLVTPIGTEHGWRRLIYVEQTRKQVATHRDNFDFPQMNPNCLERRNSNVAPQALHLMNNGMVRDLSGHFASRVRREAGADPAYQIERAYLIALCRRPSEEERQINLEALLALTDEWMRHASVHGSIDGRTPAELALAEWCHTLMNSAEFLYVD